MSLAFFEGYRQRKVDGDQHTQEKLKLVWNHTPYKDICNMYLIWVLWVLRVIKK